MKRKPTAAAWKLRKALAELAERGINGERDNAREKLARLDARIDFSQADVARLDLFAGKFQRGPYAVPVANIPAPDVANAVKWAIETRTGIPCRFKGEILLAEATPNTARTLEGIAGTVAAALSRLWQTYESAGGLRQDRNCFMLGLFEGMMNEERPAGQSLPNRSAAPRCKSKGKATAPAPGLAVHPYSLAVGYGRQIAFNVPLDQVDNELKDRLTPQIEEGTT